MADVEQGFSSSAKSHMPLHQEKNAYKFFYEGQFSQWVRDVYSLIKRHEIKTSKRYAAAKIIEQLFSSLNNQEKLLRLFVNQSQHIKNKHCLFNLHANKKKSFYGYTLFHVTIDSPLTIKYFQTLDVWLIIYVFSLTLGRYKVEKTSVFGLRSKETAALYARIAACCIHTLNQLSPWVVVTFNDVFVIKLKTNFWQKIDRALMNQRQDNVFVEHKL